MSINKIFLFLAFISLFWCQDELDKSPDPIGDLVCGKESPKKETDCTKYGTGSGMLCCWVANDKNSQGSCYLLPSTIADTKGIDGEKEFINGTYKYWSCGNNSTYLNINIIIILLILLSL